MARHHPTRAGHQQQASRGYQYSRGYQHPRGHQQQSFGGNQNPPYNPNQQSSGFGMRYYGPNVSNGPTNEFDNYENRPGHSGNPQPFRNNF